MHDVISDKLLLSCSKMRILIVGNSDKTTNEVTNQMETDAVIVEQENNQSNGKQCCDQKWKRDLNLTLPVRGAACTRFIIDWKYKKKQSSSFYTIVQKRDN